MNWREVAVSDLERYQGFLVRVEVWLGYGEIEQVTGILAGVSEHYTHIAEDQEDEESFQKNGDLWELASILSSAITKVAVY